jgi:hypothetical protein
LNDYIPNKLNLISVHGIEEDSLLGEWVRIDVGRGRE